MMNILTLAKPTITAIINTLYPRDLDQLFHDTPLPRIEHTSLLTHHIYLVQIGGEGLPRLCWPMIRTVTPLPRCWRERCLDWAHGDLLKGHNQTANNSRHCMHTHTHVRLFSTHCPWSHGGWSFVDGSWRRLPLFSRGSFRRIARLSVRRQLKGRKSPLLLSTW